MKSFTFFSKVIHILVADQDAIDSSNDEEGEHVKVKKIVNEIKIVCANNKKRHNNDKSRFCYDWVLV